MSLRILVFSGALVFLAAAGCNTSVVFNEPNPEPEPQCLAFQDETSLGATTIRFVNHSPRDLYLPTGCGALDYTLENTIPDDVRYQYDGTCLQSCGELQTTSQYDCAAGACAETVQRIPAGSSAEVTWNGLGLQSQQMPSSCWFEPLGGGTCSQIVSAPPGNYRLSVRAFAECQGYADGGCECQGDSCYGSPAGAEAFPVEVRFDHPTAEVVELVFDSCAFGCAGG
jgi:hypothetical protein